MAILNTNLSLGHEISSLAETVLQKILKLVSLTVCSSTCIIISPTRSQLLVGTLNKDGQKILFLCDLRHDVFYQNLVKALRNWLNFCHTFCLPSAQYITLVLSIALKNQRRLVCLESILLYFTTLRRIHNTRFIPVCGICRENCENIGADGGTVAPITLPQEHSLKQVTDQRLPENAGPARGMDQMWIRTTVRPAEDE